MTRNILAKICTQCGQPFTARACGPTHASLMPRSKPTPTLAALRKLAKRKGLGNVIVWLSGDAWIAEIDNAETRGIGAFSMLRGDAVSMFFSAISALPDAPKPAPKKEKR